MTAPGAVVQKGRPDGGAPGLVLAAAAAAGNPAAAAAAARRGRGCLADRAGGRAWPPAAEPPPGEFCVEGGRALQGGMGARVWRVKGDGGTSLEGKGGWGHECGW
eukprot:359071-Chlamydomonas_euryale.AAC.7